MARDGFFDTSASEIADYKGQASGAIDAGAATILGDTNTDEITPALRMIAVTNMQKNKNIYDQKIEDQKNLFKQLSSDDLQLKQTLPNDRDFIWQNFRNPIREMVMDPTVTTDYKKAAALQQKMADFKEAKAYAAVRLASINDLDKNIASEKDPIRRQRMVDHRNKMYEQSIYDQVQPFQEVIDFSKNTLVTPTPETTQLAPEIVGNAEVSKTKTVTPLKAFTEGVYFNYMNNPDHKIKSEMDAMASSVNQLPPDQKLWLVNSWNDKIRKANADNNLKPGDNDYVPEVRYDAVDKDGNAVTDGDQSKIDNYVLHATVPEIVRAQSIHDNYKNEITSTSKLTDLAAKIGLQNAEAQKNNMEAWLAHQKGKVIPSEIQKNLAETNEHNAKAQEAFEKAKTEKRSSDPADWNITQTRQIFDPANYKDTPDATGVTFGSKQLPIQGKLLMNTQLFGKPQSKLSDDQLLYLSEQFPVAGKTTFVKPEAVVYNDKNTNDPYFTAVYRIPHVVSTDKSGTKTYNYTYETRTIKPNTFMERLAKSTSPGKAAEELNKTISRYKEQTGTANINGSLYSTYDNPDWNKKNSKLNDFMNTPSK